MIWFSSRELEIALSNDSLSYWEKAKYLVFMAVIGLLAGGPLYSARPLYGAKMSALNILFSFPCGVLSAYLAYRGIRSCFLANENIDGTSFFERMACLTVPVWTKLFIFWVPLSFVLVWLLVQFKDTEPELFKIVQNIFYLLGPLWIFVYYLLLRRSFNRLGGLLKKQGVN